MTPCQQEAIEGPSALVKPKGYWGRILQNIIITYQIHRLNWKRKKPLVICRLWRKSEVEFMADKALELAFKLRPLLCIRMKCMYIRMFYCTFKHSCMYAWMRTYTRYKQCGLNVRHQYNTIFLLFGHWYQLNLWLCCHLRLNSKAAATDPAKTTIVLNITSYRRNLYNLLCSGTIRHFCIWPRVRGSSIAVLQTKNTAIKASKLQIKRTVSLRCTFWVPDSSFYIYHCWD